MHGLFKNLSPFATLSDHKLYQSVRQSNKQYIDSSDSFSTNTCSALKPPKDLSNLFNVFNKKNSQNIINCKYYDIEEIQSLNNLSHKNYLSLFHINSSFLSMKNLNTS